MEFKNFEIFVDGQYQPFGVKDEELSSITQ